MTDLSNDQFILDAVLAGGVKIPAMPRVLLDLAELNGKGEAGPREYAWVIGRDPGLAGAIFRVVGSSVFGLRAKADTLEKAITLLGLRTTHAVASGEALRSRLTDMATATPEHECRRVRSLSPRPSPRGGGERRESLARLSR